MPFPKSIGAIELSSIGIGYRIQDEMLKAASVELLIARTICSGKYLIVIGGIGQRRGGGHRSRAGRGRRGDHRPAGDPQRPPLGLSRPGPIDCLGARGEGRLGVVETFSGVSVLAAADAAAKAARDHALPHPRGDGPGRQGLVPDDRHRGRRACRRAGRRREARERGLLVSEVVIPRPSRELFGDYL